MKKSPAPTGVTVFLDREDRARRPVHWDRVAERLQALTDVREFRFGHDGGEPDFAVFREPRRAAEFLAKTSFTTVIVLALENVESTLPNQEQVRWLRERYHSRAMFFQSVEKFLHTILHLALTRRDSVR